MLKQSPINPPHQHRSLHLPLFIPCVRIKPYTATSAKDLLWLLTVSRCSRMNSICCVLQPWRCVVLSNQVMMFWLLVHLIIRGLSVLGASWQNAQVLLLVCSSQWHLALVGRRHWLRRNIVCLIVDCKASVLFPMEYESIWDGRMVGGFQFFLGKLFRRCSSCRLACAPVSRPVW